MYRYLHFSFYTPTLNILHTRMQICALSALFLTLLNQSCFLSSPTSFTTTIYPYICKYVYEYNSRPMQTALVEYLFCMCGNLRTAVRRVHRTLTNLIKTSFALRIPHQVSMAIMEICCILIQAGMHYYNAMQIQIQSIDRIKSRMLVVFSSSRIGNLYILGPPMVEIRPIENTIY